MTFNTDRQQAITPPAIVQRADDVAAMMKMACDVLKAANASDISNLLVKLKLGKILIDLKERCHFEAKSFHDCLRQLDISDRRARQMMQVARLPDAEIEQCLNWTEALEKSTTKEVENAAHVPPQKHEENDDFDPKNDTSVQILTPSPTPAQIAMVKVTAIEPAPRIISITKNGTSDTARGELMDAMGNKVPKNLRDVFAGNTEKLREAAELLRKVRLTVRGLKDWNQHMRFGELEETLDRMIEDFKDGIPHILCNKCKGTGGKGTCPHCKGSGWLPHKASRAWGH
jgi:hypothetical protein